MITEVTISSHLVLYHFYSNILNLLSNAKDIKYLSSCLILIVDYVVQYADFAK